MATIDQLQVEISAITNDFNKQISEVNSQLNGLDSAGVKASGSFDKIGVAASKAFAVTGLAVAAGIGMAVKSFANYEQLVGGVETLFKSSSGQLMEYANGAYKTAGLSANSYMEQATSFSATLLQGLGGDTKKAVEYADMAITDMSDNANKMGTNIGMIQDAYQGFAKDNFTMLDNLKLGYGGTATEMARLVNDSGVMGESFKATAENVKDIPFDQLILAIHKTQQGMGIAGTTAVEASETISGAWNSTKASFDNVLTGVEGSGEALAESMLTLFGQLAQKVPPIVGNMVSGMFEAVRTAITEKLGEGAWAIMSSLAVAIGTVVTALTIWTAVTKVAAGAQALFNLVLAANPIGLVVLAIAGLVAALTYFFTQTETGRRVFDVAFNFIRNLAITVWNTIRATWSGVAGFFSGIFNAVMNGANIVLNALRQGFSTAWNTIRGVWSAVSGFFSGIFNAVRSVASSVTSTISSLFSSAWSTVRGVWSAASGFFGGIFNSVRSIASGVTSSIASLFSGAWGNVRGVWSAATGFFSGVVNGIIGVVSSIPGRMASIFNNALSAIKNINWVGLGRDIVAGIANGLDPGAITEKMKNIASGALDTVKSFLGIKSPSRVMRDEVGKMMGAGMAIGIDQSTKDAVKSASNSAKRVMGAYGGSISTNMPSAAQLSSRLDLSITPRVGDISGRQTPVVVQLDGETLLSFLVDGINNKAFMTNSTILNV